MNPVAIFKALGHEQRFSLFFDLIRGNGSSCCNGLAPEDNACCVLDLTDRHDLAQSTISHHLRVLVDAGLVYQERRGTYRIYRVNAKTWEAFREHVATLNVCYSTEQAPPAGRLPTV